MVFRTHLDYKYQPSQMRGLFTLSSFFLGITLRTDNHWMFCFFLAIHGVVDNPKDSCQNPSHSIELCTLYVGLLFVSY